jgi:hypothetical protein
MGAKMKKIYLIGIITLTVTANLFAAIGDFNSSRSNRASTISASADRDIHDLQYSLKEMNKEDFEKARVVEETLDLENKVRVLKQSLLLGTFSNLIISNIEKGNCSDFEREEFDICINKAIYKAEIKVLGRGLPNGKVIVKDIGISTRKVNN